jgi:Zn-dependent protease with chaperone function
MTITWMTITRRTIRRMTVITALMAGMAPTAAHAGQPQQKVTVYLRDRANLPNEVGSPAKALAGQMFAKIGISLDWGKGEPAAESSPIFIELVRGTPENRMPGALAYALPYEGTHITVFYDRIEKTENPRVLLAHVMAHEITHVLQGISRHSEAGVMKAHWAGRDFGAMWFRPLSFTAEDVDLIYLGLAKRPAGTGTPVTLVATR